MKSLVNFRDIGGYQTPKGKVITGKFFRSGEPVRLVEEDIIALKDTYGIKAFYDFRGDSEIKERPDDVIEGIEIIHLDIIGAINNNASLSSMKSNNGDADEIMKLVYKMIIKESASREKYKQFLESVYEYDQDAILFHCFAGKDRTGLGAAFILKILGVSDEDIYEDYLKTNVMRKAANDILLEEAKNEGASTWDLDRLKSMLYVKKEYLDCAFETINEVYGSFDTFIEEGLGLSSTFV
ncbi:MAG: tyrosine-protein phosphatase [Coprobacillaceae bacterium]